MQVCGGGGGESCAAQGPGEACHPTPLLALLPRSLPFQLSKLSVKDGKLSLGKLRGGKIDDITVVVAYVEAVAGEAA